VADEVDCGGQDPDVTVRHQDQDGLPAMPAANRDVVERALVTQRDLACIDPVLADPTVRRILNGLPEGRAFLRALKATSGSGAVGSSAGGQCCSSGMSYFDPCVLATPWS
jgi:hypothetical protein